MIFFCWRFFKREKVSNLCVCVIALATQDLVIFLLQLIDQDLEKNLSAKADEFSYFHTFNYSCFKSITSGLQAPFLDTTRSRPELHIFEWWYFSFDLMLSSGTTRKKCHDKNNFTRVINTLHSCYQHTWQISLTYFIVVIIKITWLPAQYITTKVF